MRLSAGRHNAIGADFSCFLIAFAERGRGLKRSKMEIEGETVGRVSGLGCPDRGGMAIGGAFGAVPPRQAEQSAMNSRAVSGGLCSHPSIEYRAPTESASAFSVVVGCGVSAASPKITWPSHV